MNKVMLIGNVGKEPEIRYLEGGICTAQVRLATSTPGYTLPNGTQVPERTEWHNLLFWRKVAEVVERYVHTGDKLYVEGELRTRSYSDKRGIERYITEIWVKEMEMLSPKPQTGGNQAPNSGNQAPTGGSQTPNGDATQPQSPMPFL